VFIFSGGNAAAVDAGPSLMFSTMPKVFESMGQAGPVIGLIFFLLVLFAALTSSISLMETVVSVFMDRFKLSRRKAAAATLVLSLLLAIPSSLGFGLWKNVQLGGMGILDIFDFTSNSIMMPVVALLTCIFVGYVIKTQAITDEVKLSSPFKREKMFNLIIKYIAPVLVIGILVSSVLDNTGVISL